MDRTYVFPLRFGVSLITLGVLARKIVNCDRRAFIILLDTHIYTYAEVGKLGVAAYRWVFNWVQWAFGLFLAVDW